jgi:hypothetical protein
MSAFGLLAVCSLVPLPLPRTFPLLTAGAGYFCTCGNNFAGDSNSCKATRTGSGSGSSVSLIERHVFVLLTRFEERICAQPCSPLDHLPM